MDHDTGLDNILPPLAVAVYLRLARTVMSRPTGFMVRYVDCHDYQSAIVKQSHGIISFSVHRDERVA